MEKVVPNRSRPIRKLLSFSEVEWERVQRRRVAAGDSSFSSFARNAVLESEIRVTRIAFDPVKLRVELSRIGNNVNQIARHVNTEDVVTYTEMRAVRLLLSQVQSLISEAMDAAKGTG